MGFNISWFAVRGKEPDVVYADAGLRPTGKPDECNESPFSGAELPAGWVVVWDNECKLTQNAFLSNLSKQCAVVTCGVIEGTMSSCSSFWKEGVEVWFVEHDSSRGIEHLNIRGVPPAEFASIRDRLLNEQHTDKSTDQGMGTDYVFDIPVELAKAMTGFRYDEREDEELGFQTLELIAPPAQPQSFWRRWFAGT